MRCACAGDGHEASAPGVAGPWHRCREPCHGHRSLGAPGAAGGQGGRCAPLECAHRRRADDHHWAGGHHMLAHVLATRPDGCCIKQACSALADECCLGEGRGLCTAGPCTLGPCRRPSLDRCHCLLAHVLSTWVWQLMHQAGLQTSVRRFTEHLPACLVACGDTCCCCWGQGRPVH